MDSLLFLFDEEDAIKLITSVVVTNILNDVIASSEADDVASKLPDNVTFVKEITRIPWNLPTSASDADVEKSSCNYYSTLGKKRKY